VFAFTSLTSLADLFAPQAILPDLALAFHITPMRAALAVNAATLGMMCGALLTFLCAPLLPRSQGIAAALSALALITASMALVHGAAAFATLRFAQGVLMSMAFALATAHAAEMFGPQGWTPMLMGAYVCGNIAGNIGGRILAGWFVAPGRPDAAFLALALLNAAGALVVFLLMPREAAVQPRSLRSQPEGLKAAGWPLVACCAYGFLILCGFAGTFTYINFRLAAAPYSLTPSQVGATYLVFGAALLVTPSTGLVVRRFGFRRTGAAAALVAMAGVLLTLSQDLLGVLGGLSLVGVGSFTGQAAATSRVGLLPGGDKAARSAVYLFSYYAGGFVGTGLLGLLYASGGWNFCAWALALVFAGMAGIAIWGWSSPAAIAARSTLPAAACPCQELA
jgi:predicted MFS family arabinose efflux permease